MSYTGVIRPASLATRENSQTGGDIKEDGSATVLRTKELGGIKIPFCVRPARIATGEKVGDHIVLKAEEFAFTTGRVNVQNTVHSTTSENIQLGSQAIKKNYGFDLTDEEMGITTGPFNVQNPVRSTTGEKVESGRQAMKKNNGFDLTDEEMGIPIANRSTVNCNTVTNDNASTRTINTYSHPPLTSPSHPALKHLGPTANPHSKQTPDFPTQAAADVDTTSQPRQKSAIPPHLAGLVKTARPSSDGVHKRYKRSADLEAKLLALQRTLLAGGEKAELKGVAQGERKTAAGASCRVFEKEGGEEDKGESADGKIGAAVEAAEAGRSADQVAKDKAAEHVLTSTSQRRCRFFPTTNPAQNQAANSQVLPGSANNSTTTTTTAAAETAKSACPPSKLSRTVVFKSNANYDKLLAKGIAAEAEERKAREEQAQQAKEDAEKKAREKALIEEKKKILSAILDQPWDVIGKGNTGKSPVQTAASKEVAIPVEVEEKKKVLSAILDQPWDEIGTGGTGRSPFQTVDSKEVAVPVEVEERGVALRSRGLPVPVDVAVNESTAATTTTIGDKSTSAILPEKTPTPTISEKPTTTLLPDKLTTLGASLLSMSLNSATHSKVKRLCRNLIAKRKAQEELKEEPILVDMEDGYPEIFVGDGQDEWEMLKDDPAGERKMLKDDPEDESNWVEVDEDEK